MANWWDSALGLVGQDQESQVKDDMGDYDRKTGTVKREGGQWLFDRMLGRDQSEMDALAKERHIDTLSEGAGRNLTALGGNALLPGLDTEIRYDDDKTSLAQRTNEAKGLLQGREMAVGAGANIDDVIGTTSLGALQTLGRKGGYAEQWNNPMSQYTRGQTEQAQGRQHVLDKFRMQESRDANLRAARQDKDNYSLRLQDLERLKGQDADRMLMWQQQRADTAHSRKQDMMLAILKGIQALPI